MITSRVAEGQAQPASPALLKPDWTFPASGFTKLSRFKACTGINGEALTTAASRGSATWHRVSAFRRAEGTLTPTFQMATQPCDDIPVQLAEHLTGITVTVVPTPTHQPPIDLGDQLGNGHEASLGSRQFPDLVPNSCQCLVRGRHVEITTIATEQVAVIPQRKPEEGQAFTRLAHLDDARFLTVNRQPESSFEQPFDPADQLPGLVGAITTKSSAYRTSLALAHVPGPSPRRNCFSNQCR